MEITDVTSADGFEWVTYRIDVHNTGTEPLGRVQILNDIGAVDFGQTLNVVLQPESIASDEFTIHGGFNGVYDTRMLRASDALQPGERGNNAANNSDPTVLP